MKQLTNRFMEKVTTTPADADHPHSIYGASSASRWRNCPGSVGLIARMHKAGSIPKTETSSFATEGTEAHDWSDKVLTGAAKIDSVPVAFRTHLSGYIQHCQDLEADAIGRGGRAYHEATVPLYYRPQDTGTLDFAVVVPPTKGDPGMIEFTDLKYGVGVKVSATDNSQLCIYLLSLVGMLENEEGIDFSDETVVRLGIYQPRHHSFDGEADVWETNLGDLRDFGAEIEADYITARDAKPRDLSMLKASQSACMFCEAKGLCKVRAKGYMDVLVDFDDETRPVLKVSGSETLSTQQVQFIIKNAKGIRKVLDDTEASERQRIENGGDLRGLKLVEGKRGNRVWTNAAAAEAYLLRHLSPGESYQPQKILTASQAMKKLGDKLTDEASAELITRPDGKAAIVTIEDERQAIRYTPISQDFDNE